MVRVVVSGIALGVPDINGKGEADLPEIVEANGLLCGGLGPARVGNRIEARMAMMAITTSNSIKVKAALAARLQRFVFMGYLHQTS